VVVIAVGDVSSWLTFVLVDYTRYQPYNESSCNEVPSDVIFLLFLCITVRFHEMMITQIVEDDEDSEGRYEDNVEKKRLAGRSWGTFR
jgi:hypothetical protein